MPNVATFAISGLLALTFFLPVVQGSERHYQDAMMLQSAEYDWCNHDCTPFDRPNYFFCVQVGDKILIGSRKADWAWMPDSIEMLEQSKQVSLAYDDRSIWVKNGDRETHLSRDYSEDVFTKPECTAEVHKNWLKDFESIKRPNTVPPEAVLVPKGRRPPIPLFSQTAPHFWVTCKLDSVKPWDVCDVWDEAGKVLYQLECVNIADHLAVLPKDLVIDPLTTKVYYEIHLKNGILLKDWAKARINNMPTPDSPPPKALTPQN
jgi:hypothetical protein